jgi:hypothetical protein
MAKKRNDKTPSKPRGSKDSHGIKKSTPKTKTRKAKLTRKAKSKPKSTTPKTKRTPNKYFLVRKAVSEYCKSNYNRKCTNEEINEIYRNLKLRYFDVDKKRQLSPDEIAREIDKKLAYRNVVSMPVIFRGFDWFNLLPLLVSNDGLFFKEDDMIILNLTSVGMGVYEVPYWNLEEYWNDDLYPDFSDYLNQVEGTSGRKVSPPPYFVFDNTDTDYDKRRFVWRLDMERDSNVPVLPLDELDLNADNVLEGEKLRKERDDTLRLLDIERQKGATEGAIGKTRETELKIAEEKTKQMQIELRLQAADLLKKGLIDIDTFKAMIGL